MIIPIRTLTLLCLTGFVLLSCRKETEPEKIAVLKEITDPDQSLWTNSNRLFVANATDSLKMRTTVQVYSLKDGNLLRQFGVNSSEKVSIYNYDFELIQELEHGNDS